MKVAREFFKSPKEIPVEEYLVPGSPLCAGCGGLTTLRLMHKVLGEDVVIVNAAGCMTLLSTFPFTTLTSSWLYTTMASASAGAQGIRDALDVLKSKGKLTPEADLKVLVLAGDGSTYDMGLSPTSAAIHRGLDFWYLCYDNEAYGNTGFQLSSSSPEDSHTSTSIAEPQQHKKDIFDIWLAHHPAYVATVSAHESVDLAEKVRRSMSLTGPKLFSVARRLSHRLGLRAGTRRRDVAPRGRDWTVAAERSHRRQSPAHIHPEQVPPRGRIPRTSTPLPSSLPTATQRSRARQDSGGSRCVLGQCC